MAVDASGRPRAYIVQQRISRSATSRTPAPMGSRSSSTGAAIPPPAPSPPRGRPSSVIRAHSVPASTSGSPRPVSGSPRGRSASSNGPRDPSLGPLSRGSVSRQASPRADVHTGGTAARNRSSSGPGVSPPRPILRAPVASAQSLPRGRSPAAGTVSQRTLLHDNCALLT